MTIYIVFRYSFHMNDWGYALVIVAAVLAVGGSFISWQYGPTPLMPLSFSGAVVAALFVILILTYESEKSMEEMKRERKNLFNSFSLRLDAFYSKIEETKQELAKQMFALQARQKEMHAETTEEMERNFRELAGKMLQIENSLAKVKRFLQYEEQL